MVADSLTTKVREGGRAINADVLVVIRFNAGGNWNVLGGKGEREETGAV
ncbi:hypothetical protein [Subtercola vilae]|uniref:Uncharacterized protein n=1 Tax=Subtercola vilae TaxID=2056433 RepID=A0A4T2BVY9_9MICO|nr:hypothetical protein [Subtercola vilae]TIH35590.1 hypothetical protein D4765_11035 [Subtercola vilae]